MTASDGKHNFELYTADAKASLATGPDDPTSISGLPSELYALQDPDAQVSLPSGIYPPLDNWKLDKLVAALGRSRATWRRALVLHEWLKDTGHMMDDRLCTTLIRVCSDHGDAVTALGVYEWMKAPRSAGGAALTPTTYTYTAAMRAAQGANLLERAMAVWADARRANTPLDCRLCMTFIEICARLNLTDVALDTYAEMLAAPVGSRLAPTVHAYTAAMRAATEGGRWLKALDIWEDMTRAGCQPTGHAFAAAISACASGAQWRRAVSLFEEMTTHSIRPDVVSCTALITALASAGECDKADGVVTWMLSNGLKPNVRTYTALLTAMCNAQQWSRAVDVLDRMQQPAWGGVQPNAYSYSALLKSLGEFGQWQLAETVFGRIEAELLGDVIAPSGLNTQQRLAAPEATATPVELRQPPLPLPLPPPVAAATLHQRPPQAPARQVTRRCSKLHCRAPLGTAASRRPAPAPPASDLASTLTTTQLSALSIAAASTLFQATSSTPATATEATASGSTSEPTAPTAAVLGAIGRGRRVPSSSASSASLHSRWTAAAELHGLSLDIDRPATAPSPALGVGPLVPPSPPAPRRPALPVFPDSEAPPSRTEQDRRNSEDENLLGSLLAGRVAMQALEGTDSARQSFSLFSGVSAAAAMTAGRAPRGQQPPHWRCACSSSSSPNPRHPSAPLGHSSARSSSLPPAKQQQHAAMAAASAAAQQEAKGGLGPVAALPHTSIVNEVVCGALMLAYERSGKWQETILMLQRSLALGITPNTIMYNTAISAAGKAGQLDIAGRLFAKVRRPDAVTYETMIAAFGMCGRSQDAEAMFSAMQAAGLRPRDYAYCGLIAAYSLGGDVEGALRIRQRMRLDKTPATVYVYNALLAAAERAQQAGRGLELYAAMQREGVEPNAVTLQLLANVGRQGVATVESQQVTAAALTAAFAAAGTMLMQTGMF
ncbi:MAG: hypothetical protein WDW36_004167 [Sanguina aurantia]